MKTERQSIEWFSCEFWLTGLTNLSIKYFVGFSRNFKTYIFRVYRYIFRNSMLTINAILTRKHRHMLLKELAQRSFQARVRVFYSARFFRIY